jgi:hypothetical protein
LLVPVGRRMVLTPLAEELAQPVRDLLQHAKPSSGAHRCFRRSRPSANSASSCPITSPLC